MSAQSKLTSDEISCWGDWMMAVNSMQPGIYCIAGRIGSGVRSSLQLTRTVLESEGTRVLDSSGIITIDEMLMGMVVMHGDLRDAEDLRRVVNLANAGAVVLCSIHAMDVKGAIFNLLQSPVFGGSMEEVGSLLRALMAQVALAKIPSGLTCLNEIAVFDNNSDLQFVLENGPRRTFRDDADSKIATGIVTEETAVRAGAVKR